MTSTKQRPFARPDRAIAPASPRRAARAKLVRAERSRKPWKRDWRQL